MRKILFILSFLVSFLVTRSQERHTAYADRNAPSDTAYGTHRDTLGSGGLHTYLNSTTRDSLPYNMRRLGMVAYTSTDSSYWRWNGSNWIFLWKGSPIASIDTTTRNSGLPNFGRSIYLADSIAKQVANDSIPGLQRVLLKDSSAQKGMNITMPYPGPAITMNSSTDAAFSSYKRSGGQPNIGNVVVDVGMLGNPEANLSYNMRYINSFHSLYDQSKGAQWLALHGLGGALQYCGPYGGALDCWQASGYPYAMYWKLSPSLTPGASFSQLAINVAAGYDAGDNTTMINRIPGKASLSGVSDLVLNGNRNYNTAGIVYTNAGNTGDTWLSFGIPGGGAGKTRTGGDLQIGGNVTSKIRIKDSSLIVYDTITTSAQHEKFAMYAGQPGSGAAAGFTMNIDRTATIGDMVTAVASSPGVYPIRNRQAFNGTQTQYGNIVSTDTVKSPVYTGGKFNLTTSWRVIKDGSASALESGAWVNAAENRGWGFQLTDGANPGIALYGTNGSNTFNKAFQVEPGGVINSAGNFAANYTVRSYVDKNYVDSTVKGVGKDSFVISGYTKSPYYRAGDTADGWRYDTAVILGNSVETGLGADPQGAYAWSRLYSNMIGAVEINTAIGGTRVVQQSTGDSSLQERYTTILPNHTNGKRIYIFGYGLNDNSGFDSATWRAAYTTALDYQVTVRGVPANRILLMIPYTAGAPNLTMDRTLRSMALDKGYLYAPVRDSMIANGGFAIQRPDGLHPNNIGMQVIAQVVSANTPGAKTVYSQFNQSVIVGGQLTVGRDIWGGTSPGGLGLHGHRFPSGKGRITSYEPHWFKDYIYGDSIVLSPDRNGVITSMPAYISFGTGFRNTTQTYNDAQIRLPGSAFIGINGGGGGGLNLNTGGTNTMNVTATNSNFTGNIIAGTSLTGSQATPIKLDLGGSFANAVASASNLKVIVATGSGFTVNTSQGLAIRSGAGPGGGQITSIQTHRFIAAPFAETNISLGTTITGTVATPAFLDMGSSIADAAASASNLKLIVATGSGLTVNTSEGLAFRSANGRITSQQSHRFIMTPSSDSGLIIGPNITGPLSAPAYLKMGNSYSNAINKPSQSKIILYGSSDADAIGWGVTVAGGMEFFGGTPNVCTFRSNIKKGPPVGNALTDTTFSLWRSTDSIEYRLGKTATLAMLGALSTASADAGYVKLTTDQTIAGKKTLVDSLKPGIVAATGNITTTGNMNAVVGTYSGALQSPQILATGGAGEVFITNAGNGIAIRNAAGTPTGKYYQDLQLNRAGVVALLQDVSDSLLYSGKIISLTGSATLPSDVLTVFAGNNLSTTTLTLPSAASLPYKRYIIKNTVTGQNVTIAPTGGDFVEVTTLAPRSYVTLVSNGSSWLQVSGASNNQYGSSTQTATPGTTSYSIVHGMSGVTSSSRVFVTPRTADAGGFRYVDVDAVSITIYYTVSPTSGTSLKWDWEIKP